MTGVPVAVEVEETPIIGMITRSAAMAVVKGKETFNINKGRGQDNSYRGQRRQWDGNDSNNRDRDNRDRNSDGQGNSNRGRKWDNNNRGEGHSDRGRGRRWNPNQQYHDPGYQQESQFPNPNHYRPPTHGDINTGTQSRMSNTHIPRNHNNINHQGQTPSQQATNICQLCHSQGQL